MNYDNDGSFELTKREFWATVVMLAAALCITIVFAGCESNDDCPATAIPGTVHTSVRKPSPGTYVERARAQGDLAPLWITVDDDSNVVQMQAGSYARGTWTIYRSMTDATNLQEHFRTLPARFVSLDVTFDKYGVTCDASNDTILTCMLVNEQDSARYPFIADNNH